MISQFTTPAHLVNRDLKRELRLLCPGTSDTIRGVPVERHTGNRSHLYAIYGYTMDLECAVSVLTGWTPMPPNPLAIAPRVFPSAIDYRAPVATVQSSLFELLAAVSA